MKILLMALGALSFAIGTVAIWIPGIPTTGFYVLTAILWSKSSKRLDTWLQYNKYYKQYVHQGVFERQLPLKARIIIYLVTASMMAIPFFTTDLVWLKIVLPLTSLTQIVSMESYYRGYLWRDGIPFMKNNNK